MDYMDSWTADFSPPRRELSPLEVARLVVSRNTVKRIPCDEGKDGVPRIHLIHKSPLADYLHLLDNWEPAHKNDSPPTPPVVYGEPGHAAAWSAYWDALDRRNRRFCAGIYDPSRN